VTSETDSELEEQLAEARAQIESLQVTAADAEARAADLPGLSPSEKIKLGLQRLDTRSSR
jgi:hypothetical protein